LGRLLRGDHTRRISTIFGIRATIATALLIFGERFLPGRPIALGVVALSIITASLFGFSAPGVATTGPIPAGLPSLHGWRSACAMLKGSFLWGPDACCWRMWKAS
jgi:hypothetical protein